MSFKKKMAAANELVSQYVERPFEYAVGRTVVQKMVRNSVDLARPQLNETSYKVERRACAIDGTRFHAKSWTGGCR